MSGAAAPGRVSNPPLPGGVLTLRVQLAHGCSGCRVVIAPQSLAVREDVGPGRWRYWHPGCWETVVAA